MTKDEEKGYIERVLAGDESAYEAEVEERLEEWGFSGARAEPLCDAKHIFSHIEWHMTGYRVRLRHEIPKSYIAAAKEELKTIYALPNAFGRYTKMIE